MTKVETMKRVLIAGIRPLVSQKDIDDKFAPRIDSLISAVRAEFPIPNKKSDNEEVKTMTITEARQQLVNVLTPEAAESRLVLAIAYAMDDLEKATREAGPQIPLEDGELPQ